MMSNAIAVFVTAITLGGLGGLVGSVCGAAFGQAALFVGGFAGGVLAAPVTAAIARWRRWILPSRFNATAAGAAIGFVAAALVATNTLSSPVGPVLSTMLIGIGALIGAMRPSGDPGKR